MGEWTPVGENALQLVLAWETRNRFRLRRLSPHADFELRVEPWCIFYRVQDERVVVELIGRKKGGVLLIEGKEFEL